MKTGKKPLASQRTKTRHVGVYQRASDSRTFKGKPDMAFDIVYRHRGKLIWEKIGWTSEGYSPKLAADIRAERIRSIRHDEELPHEKKKAPLFKDAAEKYLEWARDNRSDRGAHDRTHYELRLASAIGEKRLDEISAFDLERMKSELLKEKLAPATVKHCLIVVRQIFNKAIAWGMYKGMNPIKGVKLPALQNARERFLSYEEADALLKELVQRSPLVHDMGLLSLHTGMRAGEIFKLKGQDIDLRHSLIAILDPKSGEPRKAFMTVDVREMLKIRLQVIGPDEYLFTMRNGRPLSEIQDIFGIVADELFNKGVKDRRQRVTFHTLRHTFASWLALQGESLVTIRELMGHKSYAMTQRYAHLQSDHKKRATATLEKAFHEKRTADVISMRSATGTFVPMEDARK